MDRDEVTQHQEWTPLGRGRLNIPSEARISLNKWIHCLDSTILVPSPIPSISSHVFYHESWIFPAGVSFALKQNMYWDGFCAFLPDISGLWGGGGPNPARISKFGGGGGGVSCFYSFGEPLTDGLTQCLCIDRTLLYS